MNDNGSIKLHHKYGLNPTMGMCFFCGEATGEIALLGASYREKAPQSMVLNNEPCEKCKENFAKGFLIMEANESYQGSVLTGKYWVITMEAAGKIFKDLSAFPMHKALVTPETAKRMGLYAQN